MTGCKTQQRGGNGEGEILGLALPSEPCLLLTRRSSLTNVLHLPNLPVNATTLPATSGSTPRCLTFIRRVTLHFSPFLFLQSCARAHLLGLHPDCCNTTFHDITLLIQSARLPAANPQTMPQWRLASLISKPSFRSPSIPNMLTWPSSTWTSFNFLPLELPLSPYL